MAQLRLRPRPHQQHVEATGNIVEATFDFVEATFDFVATNGNSVERNFVLSTKSKQTERVNRVISVLSEFTVLFVSKYWWFGYKLNYKLVN